MRPTKRFTWPAPVMGWMTVSNLAQAPIEAAEQLDNMFPTAQTAELRRGYSLHATLDATAQSMFGYTFGATNKLFAATASNLYEISSPASSTVTPTATLTGLSGAEWSAAQFSTPGGVFAVAVNGVDHAIYFDGTDVQPLVDETVYDLAYDALSAAFAVGQTVTGGTSGATAEILAVAPSSATAGTLKVGAITGTFQDNETLTDGATGSATSNIPTGTSTASSVAITGVSTSALSQVWLHKERLFFVEKDTQDAWYLPVESIGGAAAKFPLGSVFKLGGTLLFGATWSLDSGEGIDDKCVFVTDQGEIAVYSGTDPSTAVNWSLDGVYRIGSPVDKYAAFKVGGELMVVTDEGIIPLSQALQRDRVGLRESALTANIEDEWQDVIAKRTSAQPIRVAHWASQGRLYVSTPAKSRNREVAFVANSRTRAWCRYTNWDMRSVTEFGDAIYFGADGGAVYLGESGGNDAGETYTGVLVPKFSNFGSEQFKLANRVSLRGRTTSDPSFKAVVYSDFQIDQVGEPTPMAPLPSSSVWGTGVWGVYTWGDEDDQIGFAKWKAAGANGYYLAPGVLISCNQTVAPEMQIASIQIRYEEGRAL